MRRAKYRRKRFTDDESALTGLPLRIFIMVVIAGVCLVVILGFIVVSKPDLDNIYVEPIKVNGIEQNKIWANWTEDTNTSIFTPKRGEHWYAGAKLSYNHEPNKNLYDSFVTIVCSDDDGNPMSNIDVVISGAGVLDSDKTDTNGKVTLSLKNCHLGPNDSQGEIKIEAKYDSTFGTQKKTKTITVLAGGDGDGEPIKGVDYE